MKKTITILLTLCLSAFGFGQNVNIPDANFKAYLVGNPTINTNNDSEISVEEAEAFSDTINVSRNTDLWFESEIKSLIGIEAFVNITGLNCYHQRIDTLSLHSLTKLIYLNCSANFSLSSLNTSNNSNLEYLKCDSLLDLEVLDITQNPNLTYLNCNRNQLSSLDLSNNKFLTYLNCSRNQLNNLSVTKNIALTTLYCDYNQLSQICISQSHDTSNWQKDASAEWSTTCEPLALSEKQSTEKAQILKAYNLQGQEVPVSTKGEVIILLYDNGMREKTYVAE